MQTVIIVIHLMIVIALVGVVLVQKSEGGGLGIGGGSGFMSARGAANVLTRTTGILAALFFITSLALSLLARYGAQPLDILDQAPQQSQGSPAGAPANGGKGILDQLNSKSAPGTPAPATSQPSAPSGSQPAAPAPSSSTAPAATGSPAQQGSSTAPATQPAAKPSGAAQQPQVPDK